MSGATGTLAATRRTGNASLAQRQVALRALAQAPQPAQANETAYTPATAARPRRLSRRAVSMLSVLAVLAVIGVVVANIVGAPHHIPAGGIPLIQDSR